MNTVIIAMVVLFIIWRLIRWKFRWYRIDTQKRTLFVTAHPDDELMFFGPVLIDEIRARVGQYRMDTTKTTSEREGTRKQSSAAAAIRTPSDGIDHKVHLVCLSNGNFYLDGHKREIELQKACEALQSYCGRGALSERDSTEHNFLEVSIVNDQQLQDDQHKTWPAEAIVKHVKDYVRRHNIGRIITFDPNGISSHPNHCSISDALTAEFGGDASEGSIELWRLITVPLWRKYLSIFDIIPAYFSILFMKRRHRRIHLLSLFDYLALVYALKQHKSQMLWFRYLYFCTSRYMFINTLEKL